MAQWRSRKEELASFNSDWIRTQRCVIPTATKKSAEAEEKRRDGCMMEDLSPGVLGVDTSQVKSEDKEEQHLQVSLYQADQSDVEMEEVIPSDLIHTGAAGNVPGTLS